MEQDWHNAGAPCQPLTSSQEMKRAIIAIFILIPSQSLASIANDIREVVEEGSGFLGFILAGIFGYLVGYPFLVCIFLVKFVFSRNRPIFENAKKAASEISDDFVQNFLILFVFILPLVSIIPAFIFNDWFRKMPFIFIYAMYTAFSLLVATVFTLRRGAK